MAQESTYLEFSDDKSHKFYEVILNGVEVTIRYGRIGDTGSTSIKTYDTEAKAQTEATKAINSKLKKGYEIAMLGDRSKRPILRGIERLHHLRRTAWSPIVEPRKDFPLASKYGGLHWSNPDEPGMICPACGQPKVCDVQLNLQDLPPELTGQFGQGLIQVMLCKTRGCRNFYYLSGPENVRIIQPVGTENLPSPSPDSHERALDYFAQIKSTALYDNHSGYAYQIVGWQSFDDYPTYNEAQEVYKVEYEERLEEDLFLGESNPRIRDKLGGWPCFWQHFEGYPTCSICQKPMQFLFLFCNGPAVLEPYELVFSADCPISLFQCHDHPDQFGMHMDAL